MRTFAVLSPCRVIDSTVAMMIVGLIAIVVVPEIVLEKVVAVPIATNISIKPNKEKELH